MPLIFANDLWKREPRADLEPLHSQRLAMAGFKCKSFPNPASKLFCWLAKADTALSHRDCLDSEHLTQKESGSSELQNRVTVMSAKQALRHGMKCSRMDSCETQVHWNLSANTKLHQKNLDLKFFFTDMKPSLVF